jgi:hypothetical protein
VTIEEWDALLQGAASSVVFLTWQWQRAWWRHFGVPETCRLHLLSVRDEGGALVGVAPLFVDFAPLPPVREYRQGVERPVGEGEPLRLVRFVGGIEVADYLDVIASEERLEEVWSAVLDYLMHKRDEWDVVDLHSLPQFSPSREILPRLALERGLSCQVLAEDVAPVLELPEDWDTYLMSLRKKDRHELRRKVRKLEGREDVRWRLVPPTDHEQMHEAMHTFLKLHRSSGAEKALFMDEKMAAYFLDMTESLLDTGWLDLAILTVDSEPASRTGYTRRFCRVSSVSTSCAVTSPTSTTSEPGKHTSTELCLRRRERHKDCNLTHLDPK